MRYQHIEALPRHFFQRFAGGPDSDHLRLNAEALRVELKCSGELRKLFATIRQRTLISSLSWRPASTRTRWTIAFHAGL